MYIRALLMLIVTLGFFGYLIDFFWVPTNKIFRRVQGVIVISALVVVGAAFIIFVFSGKSAANLKTEFTSIYDDFSTNMIIDESFKGYLLWFPETDNQVMLTLIEQSSSRIEHYNTRYANKVAAKNNKVFGLFIRHFPKCHPIKIIPDPTNIAWVDKGDS